MINQFLVVLILAQFVTTGFCHIPQSPCPKIFRYKNETNGKIIGIVEILPPLPNKVPLMLRVLLNYHTVLHADGSMEFHKPKHGSRPVQQAIDQGKSLTYRIEFPVQRPLPFVKEISFNNRRMCSGGWPIINVVEYETNLYPPAFLSQLHDQSNSSNIVNQLPKPTTFMPPTSNIEIRENCGISKSQNQSIDIRFDRGEKTYPGEWPWLAAIFILSKTDFEFKCIGNLVSRKHIITVAHCFKRRNKKAVSPKAVSVSLGKYVLEISDEPGSLNKQVSEIRIHPDFRKNDPSGDSDLAILFFEEPVEFSSTIQPICLWKKPIELDKIVGEVGIVVGWGRFGKHYTSELRMTTALIASQEDCLRSYPSFIEITSNRTLCAGNRDGRGPCNGDSGSGLIILDSKTGRYHLRGIVALSLYDKEKKSCNLEQYVVYVDVAKYQNWIEKQIYNYDYLL